MSPVNTLDEFHFANVAEAATALAAQVAEQLIDGLARRDQAVLLVSGGRSPIPFFEQLSKARLDWSRVWVGLVDERWVPADHADSNERLLREHLLQNEAASAQLLPLKTNAATPAEAVAERSDALRKRLPIDALVLGMGEDGHTASLFPGAVGLEGALDANDDALLVAIDPPAAKHARLGLTINGILQARRIFLSIAGQAKHDIYRTAATEASPLQYPVAAVLRQRTVPVSVFWSA